MKQAGMFVEWQSTLTCSAYLGRLSQLEDAGT